jgi:SPP1 gp7 family putative phage head morphogenesis protein
MPPALLARILAVIARHRAERARADAAAIARLTIGYRRAWQRIDAELAQITRQLAEVLADAGLAGASAADRAAWLEQHHPAWIYQEQRLRAFRQAAMAELARLGDTHRAYLTSVVPEAAERAVAQILELLRAGSREPARGIASSWVSLPRRTLNAIIATTLTPGSPLQQLIGRLPGDTATRLTAALIDGVALGRDPLAIATQVRRAHGLGLLRAITITRTEIMRVHRETTREVLAEQDVGLVRGWIWSSAADANTCVVCWAMHGTRHSLAEPFGSHPNCRCSPLPLTASWAELGFGADLDDLERQDDPSGLFVPGTVLFDRLDVATQLRILGPGKLNRYAAGDLELLEMVGYADHADWGPSRFERALREILRNPGIQPGVLGLPPAPTIGRQLTR